MPPKKQEQSLSAPYKPCYVLPIFVNGHNSAAASALSKPVNIKKNIDNQKIIQILKDKGLQSFIVQGKINQKGRLFVCENIKTVCDQFVLGLSKPADPKKDAKKDAKKQTKKQDPIPQNIAPPIQINHQKSCNDFFIFLDIPATPQQLQIILAKDIRIDIVVIVKQKVKPGTRKPNYQLLNQDRSHQDLSKTLKQTTSHKNTNTIENQNIAVKNKLNSKEMIEQINQYRQKIQNQNPNKNIVILQIPFMNDLSKPQINQDNFIKSFFQRICKCTKQLDRFIQWKSGKKLVPMIQPIKQKITKQVQVEDKNDKGKKGGKAAQPVFQTVQQIIEKKYQDFPENIKSDLKQYFVARDMNKKVSNEINEKDNQSIYKTILDNCINSLISQQNQENKKSDIQSIALKIKNKFELEPLNKVKSQSIANKLRNINYPKNISMGNHLNFQYPKIQQQLSFMELSQKCQKNKEQLRVQFVVNKLQILAKANNPKIGWSFVDRQFLQKFTKQQLESIINQQLLNDPQVFTGYLQTEGIKLMVMSRTNPPGRVLYHNSIMEWKVLPNFLNWTDSFLKSQQLLAKNQFYDYPFEQAGNLAIKAKNMMPADNTIIRDQMYAIGNKRNNIVQLYKDHNKFGLTKKQLKNGNHIYTYWHDFNDEYRLRIFKTKIHIYGSVTNVEQNGNQKKQQIKTENIEKVQSSLGVQIERKNNYIVMMDPNPIIFWHQNTQQKIRQISTLGTITSYKNDGSIHIYFPNGDTSIFKNGKWKRIINDQFVQNGQKIQKIQINVLYQGQNVIKIREDQTMFIIDPNGNTKIIFSDGTQIYEYVKQKKREIKTPGGPFIRIFLPRDYNLNLIGHGSAFAYLGFKNILERSYDGYLFEFIDNQISSHFYTERYELNGKIQTQNIRLVVFKDSSILKVNSRSANIVYVSPTKNQLLNEELLNQRWLQTFTTSINHGEGVFNIDLNKGHIQNKDSQTNKFIAKGNRNTILVDQRSQAYIAVSFIMQDEDDSISNFPNGFHIKEQNYFLPPPTNRIPARIFSINQDGSGTEYLSKDQIQDMKEYTVIKQPQGNKNVIQYSRQMKPKQSYMSLTFSQTVNMDVFGLPDVLRTFQTRESLIPVHYYDIKHRTIEQIGWGTDYSSLTATQDKVKAEKQQKYIRKQTRKQTNKKQQRIFQH